MPYFWNWNAASLTRTGCSARTKPMSSFDTQTSARSRSPAGTMVIRMVPGAATVPGGVGGEVLDRAGLRRAQLEQLVAVPLLGELLAQALDLRRELDALGLQLAAVVGADLRQALLRLRRWSALAAAMIDSWLFRSCSFSMRSRCLSVYIRRPAKPSFASFSNARSCSR